MPFLLSLIKDESLQTEVGKGQVSPVVELESRPPVWCFEKRLQCSGGIDRQVEHQEEPVGGRVRGGGVRGGGVRGGGVKGKVRGEGRCMP